MIQDKIKLKYNESCLIFNCLNNYLGDYIKYCKEKQFYTKKDFDNDLYYKMIIETIEKYKQLENYIIKK